ncbi:MAG TPA: hypothetical protein VFB81_00910 [Myxococcales bacterium]|nr:hypothetical protein [Myxococcales bacterium]
MSISLTLSRHRKAKVWIGHLPGPPMDVHGLAERWVIPGRRHALGTSVVAVELAIPHGGKTSFGAVGAHLVEDEDEDARELIVAVPVDAVGCLYRDSMASFSDSVRTGLPQPYSDALSEGIAAMAKMEGAPAGKLSVTWAAHGRTSSSPAMFRLLGGLLVELMIAPAWSLDEEGLMQRFETLDVR